MSKMGTSQYDKLNSNYNEMGIIIDKQEKKVQNLELKAMLLVVCYIFFGALIFSAISQRSAIPCNYWWIPFSLSLLIAIIFGLSFTSAAGEWFRTRYQNDVNLAELEIIYHQMFLAKRQGTEKEGSSGTTSNQSSSYQKQQRIPKADMFRVYQRYAFIYLTAFTLVAYTALILKACHSLTCNAGA